MDSLDSLNDDAKNEIHSWIMEYLVFAEKFNEYYCIFIFLL